jgi:hypothetical protein
MTGADVNFAACVYQDDKLGKLATEALWTEALQDHADCQVRHSEYNPE